MKKEMTTVGNKEVVVAVDNSPASMMQMALSSGTDLSKIEKMMELQERWEANEAKKAYVQAMADFKADPPVIHKNKSVGYTSKRTGETTGYKHATLGNVTNKINASLAKHGLSSAWTTEQANGQVNVTCTITHSMGHSESTSLSSAPDNSGKKNPIQSIGSAISYLQRYTILSLTGLATHDMDDDGQATASPPVNEKQVSSIVDMMVAAGVDQADYLKYLGVEEVSEIQAKNFNAIMKELGDLKK